MLVLLGKTASGKDSLKKELIKLGYQSVVTTTTRPMRDGEINGVSYHFVDDDTFLEMEVTGKLAESTYYETAFGRWYYGSQLKDLKELSNEKKVVILNPDGIYSLMTKIDMSDWMICYIDCSEETIKKRLEQRGDDSEEAERRLEADRKDFVNIKRVCDHVFTNENNTDIESLARIIDFMYGRNSK